MRKIGIIMFMWMLAYTSRTSKAFEALQRNPLEGSRERWPGDTYADQNSSLWGSRGGGEYVYYGDENLTRLLDVGACKWYDSSISFVPALDGTSPHHTLCQDHYSMKFVFFDLQLVELKAVDPVGGSFRVELQMILHWMDTIISGSDGTTYTDDCSFVCDTTSPRPMCCDNVWVPPLHLPRCEIHKIKSSTPSPKAYFWSGEKRNIEECFSNAECYWRRFWYINIDATCASNMDFHNFPFDVQSLSIDILNPYASRTWFQLTSGFLQDNIDEGISNIDLSPDRSIPGWYVKDFKVSSTCGTTSVAWKQTFLTQNILLMGLNNKSNAQGSYHNQHDNITAALRPDTLKCAKLEDFNKSASDADFMSPTNFKKIYKNVKDDYGKRLDSTLENYRQCINEKGENFSWNKSAQMNHWKHNNVLIPDFGYFNTSDQNIKRSFSILDLKKDEKMSKVWFPCSISAIANLTIPGLRVTIIVQRYRQFYVMKLIFPTIACVAFSFSAFGLHPKELVGRLTVVVPSAIALTALQSLVVSSDLPPVAYIAPSTYIILFSYLAQLVISFESVLVKWIHSRKRPNWLTRSTHLRREGPIGAPIMDNTSIGYYFHQTNEQSQDIEMANRTSTREPGMEESRDQMGTRRNPEEQEMGEQSNEMEIRTLAMPNVLKWFYNTLNGLEWVRILDFVFMVALGALYIMAIIIYTLPPSHHSKSFEKEAFTDSISLWQRSTD